MFRVKGLSLGLVELSLAFNVSGSGVVGFGVWGFLDSGFRLTQASWVLKCARAVIFASV